MPNSSYQKPTQRKTWSMPKGTPTMQPRMPVTLSNPDDDMHSIEQKMLDDVGLFAKRPTNTVDNLLRERAKQREQGGTGTTQHADNHFSLLTSMTGRLTSLEKVSMTQAAMLREKDTELARLRETVQSLKQAQGTTADTAETIQQLKQEGERWRRQALEMEQFLRDYGLQWVGFHAEETTDDVNIGRTQVEEEGQDLVQERQRQEEGGGGKPHVGDGDGLIFFEMQKLKLAVADLNSLVEDGGMKVVNENGVHKFRPEDTLTLICYRNGMWLNNGPLRPYTMPEAQAFLGDMLEGYFPYELKDQYPDGVFIAVEDKSEEMYDKKNEASSNPFAGAGHRVGGHQSKEHFLNNLPKNVIAADGKVVNVREGIANMLNNEKTPGAKAAGKQAVRRVGSVNPTLMSPGKKGEVTTLRVKMDDGSAPLLITMQFTDTVGMVRAIVASERSSGSNFELRTSFPAKVFTADDDNMSLKDAGLCPNGTLIARCKK